MSDPQRMPMFYRKVLGRLIPKRFRTEAMKEIETEFCHICRMESRRSGLKYLGWEVGRLLVEKIGEIAVIHALIVVIEKVVK